VVIADMAVIVITDTAEIHCIEASLIRSSLIWSSLDKAEIHCIQSDRDITDMVMCTTVITDSGRAARPALRHQVCDGYISDALGSDDAVLVSHQNILLREHSPPP
jgi:hypothetical protein